MVGLTPFVPDSSLYDDILSNNQVGNGALGRYRGSAFQNGAGLGTFFRGLFSRFSRFATPLVRSAMPHMKSAMESAKPHLSTAAQTLLNEAGKGIVQKISSALTPRTAEVAEQSGSGIGVNALVAHPLVARRPRYQRRPALQHPSRAKAVSRGGRGGRGRHKRSATRLKRIPPYDFPDSF